MGGFSGAIGSLWVEVGAKIQKFESGMADVSKLIDKTITEAEQKFAGFDKLGSSLKSVGLGLTAAITLPITGVGLAAANMAKDFELSIRQVTSLLGEAGPAAFAPFSAGVLDISKRMGIDAVGAAKALYEAISAGIPKENAMTFLEVASKAAIAGVTETKVAVDGITTVLNSYRLGADQATKVSDAMFTAVNIGKFTFEQLAGSMAIAIPQAELLGISFQEVLAAASTITSKGVPVSVAMTQIAAAMRSVTAPGKEMEELFKKIGVSSGESLIRTRGFQGAIEAVRGAAEGSSKTLQDAVGRIEGYAAIVSLTGENAQRARGDIDRLNKSAGDTDAAFAEINKSFSRQLSIFTNMVKAIGIELGKVLLPVAAKILEALKPVVDIIGSAVKWFGQLPDPVKAAAIALGAMALAAGPLVFALGVVASSISTIAGLFAAGGLLSGLGITAAGFATFALAVPLATAALVALGVWIYKNWKAIVATLAQAWDGISDIWMAAWTPIKDFLVDTWRSIAEIAVAVWKPLHGFLVDTWGSISEIAMVIWKPLSLFFGEVWKDIGPATTKAWTGTAGFLKGVWTEIAQFAVATWGSVIEIINKFLNVVAKIPGVQKLMNLDQAWEGAKKLEEQTKKTTEAVSAHGTQQAKSAGAVDSHTKTLKDQGKAHDALSESVKTAKKNYENVARAFVEGKASAESLEKAQIKLRVAQDNLDPTQVLQRSAKAWQETSERYVKDAQEIIKAGEQLKTINLQIEKQESEMSMAMGARAASYGSAHKEMVDKATTQLEVLKTRWVEVLDTVDGSISLVMEDRIPEHVQVAVTATGKLADAYKTLNTKSTKELQDLATEAGKAYDLIVANGEKAPRVLGPAWVTYEEARIAAAEAMGEEIPESQRKALEKMKASLEDHHKKTKTGWDAWAKQVSTIITDVGKNIVDRFIKAGDLNKKLDEDAAKLKESLAGREQTYTEFADNVATTLADIHADYEADLAKDEETLRESLDERRKDYAEYAADIADNLVKFTKQNAKNADKERRALEDSLEDRTRDYDDYVGDVEDRIRDIRSGHARSVATETQNLNESLADRKTDYDRYVEDVGIRLARIRAQNKGQFSEEEADLLLSLKRRTEDFQAFQTETITRIGEVAAKHKLEEEQQVKDQQEALARRTRDFNLYRDEITANLAEVTAKHKEAQEQEEADLAASLAKKKAELEKFEADLATQFEGRRSDALAKLQKQEADLTASLEKQRAEWEKYKNDIAVQLQEIEDKHLGIFGKIASVGKGIFADIGAAVSRFVAEELIGKLFKELKTLAIDILPSLGKTMTAIFGGGSGLAVQVPDWVSGVGSIPGAAGGAAEAAGGAASAAGGIAGGAGQAAGAATSGITAIVGAVAAVGSLISGVFGNFQMAAMNKVLDLIEVQVRRGAQFLGDRGDGGIVSAALKSQEYLGYITATGDTIGKKLDEWLEPCKNNLATIRESIPLIQTRLDSIANYTQYGSTADRENTSVLNQLRELFSSLSARQPIIQVFINQQPVAASAVSMRLQGSGLML